MERSQLKVALLSLQRLMQQQSRWQSDAPHEAALQSQLPFCLDTLTLEQWLQFVFIPRMHALMQANAAMPTNLSIAPYAEQVLQGDGGDQEELLAAIRVIDVLFNPRGGV